MRILRYGFLAALAIVLFAAGPAMAHKVNLFAYAEDGVVYAEGYFPDGRPVEKGGIEVFDSHGKELYSGTTDKEGKISFPIPAHEDLIIKITASMGHKNTFTLRESEL